MSHVEFPWVTLSHVEPCWVTLSHVESRWVTLSHVELLWVTLSRAMSHQALLFTFSALRSCGYLRSVPWSHIAPSWAMLGHTGHVELRESHERRRSMWNHDHLKLEHYAMNAYVLNAQITGPFACLHTCSLTLVSSLLAWHCLVSCAWFLHLLCSAC